MVTLHRGYLQTLVLLTCVVNLSRPVCVDVPSDTEAVQGKPMRLTCISCMKREEVKPMTHVDWYFTPKTEGNITDKIHIYRYEVDRGRNVGEQFKGRLVWNGSQDLQDLSIWILDVSFNDSGFYECRIHRKFDFGLFTPSFVVEKNVSLNVREKASKDTTAIYSEIMMYVLLVFLTFWLLVEMVYCYRKISRSDDQAQDTAY